MRIEETILSNLVNDEEYTRKVIPFIEPEYFQDAAEKIVFEQIAAFIDKYNNNPTKEALLIEVNKAPHSEQMFKDITTVIENIKKAPCEAKWLLDSTESFCKERAVYNAIMKSISIMDGEDKEHEPGAIPDILSDALSVAFDKNVGHDYFRNAEDRFNYYNEEHKRLPFDIDILNAITQGGIRMGTLWCWLGGTGAGKSLIMCHQAAANLMDGRNVLYLTMEMGEEEIAERIDANLMNVNMDEVESLPKDIFAKKIAKVHNRTKGKLMVKQFFGQVNVNHFRYLLKELKLKKNFTPDVIYVDYLNLCASARLKYGSNVNTYLYVKSIAEEIRSLAMEYELPIITATQMNRSGLSDSDPTLENVSESTGLSSTVDYMVSIVRTEELDKLGQVMFKQLKNRYGDLNYYRRFVVGIDRGKMRLYNTEQDAQDDIMNDTPVMDNADFGERYNEEESMKFMTKKAGRKDFAKLFG